AIAGSGIECRNVAGGMMLVLQFDQPITGGSAKVSKGVAQIGEPAQFQGSRLIVRLNGVADAQAVVVTVSDVTNAAKEKLPSADVAFRVLVGDVNADGKVNTVDANLCRNAAAKKKPVSGSTYRTDITLNGVISAADLDAINAAMTHIQAQPLDGGSAAH